MKGPPPYRCPTEPPIKGAKAEPSSVRAIIVEVSKLELKPGDAIVLKFPQKLTPEDSAQVKDSMDAMFPNRRVLILSEGIDIAVVSQIDETNAHITDGGLV